MIEVEIQNFQSIDRVALCIDGFTAIVGRSNIGKSSIVRAIQSALTGAAGTDFVRHGSSCERRLKNNKKCKCQATVRIATGKLALTWEKGDAVNQYTVVQDGAKKVYTAVDRGTPDFLLPDFQSVKVGSSSDLIQVSEQFSPIFLLDQSGPAVADVLSDVARLDSINEALRLANKDRKEATATRKVRERDVGELRASLGEYEGLDAAVARVDGVEGQYHVIKRVEVEVEQLGKFIASTVALVTSARALAEAVRPQLPEPQNLMDEGAEVSRLGRWLGEVMVRAPIVRQLQGIDKVALPDGTPLAKGGSDLNRLRGWVERVGVLTGDLQGLKTVVDFPVPLSEVLVAKAKGLNWLAECFQLGVGLTQEVGELTAQLAAATEEEKVVLEEYRELGVCPTCSQAFNVVVPEKHSHEAAESPLNGLLCDVCGEPQYETPSGEVCKNGHGGAPGIVPEAE